VLTPIVGQCPHTEKEKIEVELDGKLAIVTGAGTGIGQAIATTLAKEGANVVIADVDLHSAANVAREVESIGRQALAIKTDVSDRNDVIQMVDKTLHTFERVDILVNNAAVNKQVLAEELDEADWDRIMNVNAKGVFLCCQAIGKQMIKQKHGKIINIASTSAHRGLPWQIAYCASKGGVIQITKTLAVEWAKYNINVNAVSPSVTITPMLKKFLEDTGKTLQNRLKRIPLGRPNQPEDIANAVLFLASPESDNITGQEIIVDCGVSALYWPAGE